MPLMRSPDGTETHDVPDSEVARLKGMGATLAQGPDPFPPGTAIPVGLGLTGLAALMARRGSPPPQMATPGSPVLRALGRFAVKQIPGMRVPMDVLDMMREMRGPAPAAEATATSPVTPEAMAVPPQVPQQLPPGTPSGTPSPGLPDYLVQLTEEDIAKLPQLKNRTPGTIIRRSSLERMYEQHAAGQAPAAAPAPSAGTVPGVEAGPTRPITLVKGGKPQAARAPVPGGPNGPGVGKGLPGTRLARRALAMERMQAARAAEPGKAPLEILKGGQSPLEAQLVGSIEAEQAMKQAGISAAERTIVRNALRSMGGNALQLLPFIIGAKPIEQQIGEAAPLLEQLRMGHGAPVPPGGY